MVLDKDVVFLMVCILYIHLISLRVSLFNLFKQLFKLPMKVFLVLVIALIRIVVSVQGVHLLAILGEFVPPYQPDLLVLVQFREHIIVLDLYIILMNSLVVGILHNS